MIGKIYDNELNEPSQNFSMIESKSADVYDINKWVLDLQNWDLSILR